MNYIKPLLIIVLLLAGCQMLQDPEKMEKVAADVLALQAQIEAIEEGGGEVPPELMTALADLVETLAESEGAELPFDVQGAGISAAVLLGLYNQIFGSRRSKRLEANLPA